MTVKEIMNTLEENYREMHKYDRCYLYLRDSGLAAHFNCHISNNCFNAEKCPYSCKTN